MGGIERERKRERERERVRDRKRRKRQEGEGPNAELGIFFNNIVSSFVDPPCLVKRPETYYLATYFE
eukprot:1328031-Amorphochlora_amoeboformis.AAC.1